MVEQEDVRVITIQAAEAACCVHIEGIPDFDEDHIVVHRTNYDLEGLRLLELLMDEELQKSNEIDWVREGF